jgi:hypothetical protein
MRKIWLVAQSNDHQSVPGSEIRLRGATGRDDMPVSSSTATVTATDQALYDFLTQFVYSTTQAGSEGADITSHGVVDAPSANSSSTRDNQSPIVCPLAGCARPAMIGKGSFARHLRLDHPDSPHAQSLESISKAIGNVSPTRPTKDEHIADLERASSENAPTGTFGHLSTNEWEVSNATERTKLAHGRLIHGKYGVIAPKKCAECNVMRKNCMQYQ